MSLKTIPEFHELRLPHEQVGRKNQWCAYSSKNGMYYLLNGDRWELADLADMDVTNISSEIHFESEAKCHEAAREYYSRHGRNYPHTERQMTLVKKNMLTKPVDPELKSEHMSFK